MSNNVYANNEEVACKAGMGKSICAFPDTCMTPPENPATPPGVPVPYPNTGMDSDTTDGSRTVVVSGKEAMLKNKSYFKSSMGDEAGCAAKKGVVSSVNRGKAYFIAWSMDVKFEGENVVRNLDMTTHNHASPVTNTPPQIFAARMALMNNSTQCRTEKIAINTHCGKKGEKMKCPSSKGVKAAKTKRNKAKEGSAARAAAEVELQQAYADYAAAMQKDPCQRALRCAMMPFRVAKSKKGCCPHQTPEHIIQGAQFFYGKAAGGRRRNECTSYEYEGAPCVCAEGGATVATHGLLGAERKAYINTNHATGETWKFGDAVKCGAHSTSKVFSNCRPGCIESQLRQGSHAGMDDNTEIGKDQSDTMSQDQAQKFKRRWTTYYSS
jgi:hypothetical protein